MSTASEHSTASASIEEVDEVDSLRNRDLFNTILGDALNDHIIFLTGSTPKLIADKIELSSALFRKNKRLAKDFLAVLCICCIGHRRTLEDYMAKKGGPELKPFMDDNFLLNKSYNYSALNVAGHSVMAAGGRTKNFYIREARKRMGGDHIWNAVFSNGSCSEVQIKIFNQRKASLDRREAIAAGRRILKVLASPFEKKTVTIDEGEEPGDEDQDKDEDAAPVVRKRPAPVRRSDRTPRKSSAPAAPERTAPEKSTAVDKGAASASEPRAEDEMEPFEEITKNTVKDLYIEGDKSIKKRKLVANTEKGKAAIRKKINAGELKIEEGETDMHFLTRLSAFVINLARGGYTSTTMMETLMIAAQLCSVDPATYLPAPEVIVLNDEEFAAYRSSLDTGKV